MRYLLSLESSNERAIKQENLEEAKKEIAEIIEKAKPEALYFSTIRRATYIVVNIDDPHVEGRLLFEKLSKWGNVTIDPVSTFEEFGAFLDAL